MIIFMALTDSRMMKGLLLPRAELQRSERLKQDCIIVNYCHSGQIRLGLNNFYGDQIRQASNFIWMISSSLSCRWYLPMMGVRKTLSRGEGLCVCPYLSLANDVSCIIYTFPWWVWGRIRQGGRDTRWGSCDAGSPDVMNDDHHDDNPYWLWHSLGSSIKSVHERHRNSDGLQVKWSVFRAIWLKRQDP